MRGRNQYLKGWVGVALILTEFEWEKKINFNLNTCFGSHGYQGVSTYGKICDGWADLLKFTLRVEWDTTHSRIESCWMKTLLASTVMKYSNSQAHQNQLKKISSSLSKTAPILPLRVQHIFTSLSSLGNVWLSIKSFCELWKKYIYEIVGWLETLWKEFMMDSVFLSTPNSTQLNSPLFSSQTMLDRYRNDVGGKAQVSFSC